MPYNKLQGIYNEDIPSKYWGLRNPLNQEPYSTMIDNWLFNDAPYPEICSIKFDEYRRNLGILKRIAVLMLLKITVVIIIW